MNVSRNGHKVNWIRELATRTGIPIITGAVLNYGVNWISSVYQTQWGQPGFAHRVGVVPTFTVIAIVATLSLIITEIRRLLSRPDMGKPVLSEILCIVRIMLWIVAVLAFIFMFVAYAYGNVVPGTKEFARYWPVDWYYLMGWIPRTLSDLRVSGVLSLLIAGDLVHTFFAARKATAFRAAAANIPPNPFPFYDSTGYEDAVSHTDPDKEETEAEAEEPRRSSWGMSGNTYGGDFVADNGDTWQRYGDDHYSEYVSSSGGNVKVYEDLGGGSATAYDMDTGETWHIYDEIGGGKVRINDETGEEQHDYSGNGDWV